MPRVTQADVVRGAIQQLSKRGGYNRDSYFRPKPSSDLEYAAGPGEHVGATCAIGGVEQAIWRLTGESVVGVRQVAAKEEEATEFFPSPATPREKLYAGVMRRLNAKARRLFSNLDDHGDPIRTVEDLTFVGSVPTSRRRMLQVFEAVLADLEAKAHALEANRDPGDETDA